MKHPAPVDRWLSTKKVIATTMTATRAATTRVTRRPDGERLPGLARIMTAKCYRAAWLLVAG